MISLASYHFGQSKQLTFLQKKSDFFFAIFFSIETVLKMLSQGWKIWNNHYNKLDLIATVIAIVVQYGFAIQEGRVFFVLRLGRLINRIEDLRRLFQSFAQ